MKLPKVLSLAEIAAVVDGVVEGCSTTKVDSVALDPFKAQPGQLAVVFDPGLVKRISECTATAVVVPKGVRTNLPRVEVERPLLALSKMLKAIEPRQFLPSQGIHPTAVIDPTCRLGEQVAIGPYVVIGAESRIGKGSIIMAGSIIGGAVSIGDDCLIRPSCLIADYVQIGNRVIMQQGASLGSDGFGYVTERPSHVELRLSGLSEESQERNPLLKIPQIGTVIVEDDVEIGAYATVDRATMGATIIGRGSKIDNQVMIAHNTRIGQDVIIVAHSGVAGSCVIGDRAVLAGHVAVKDHITIGAEAIIEGCAGVMRDVEAGQVVTGTPAVPAREFFTNIAYGRKLPAMAAEVKALKKKVSELEAMLAGSKQSQA